jgi:hypothetical protein
MLTFSPNWIFEGQSSGVMVTVIDADIGGKSSPAGTVMLSSNVTSDSFTPSNNTCVLILGANNTASCSVSINALDNISGDGAHAITAGYSGDDRHLVQSGSEGLIVKNVAPVVTSLTSNAPINENGSVNLTGSFADPGILDTHAVVINWGDGSPNTTIPVAAGVVAFAVPHQYLDDNPTATPSDPYPIVVTVTDKDAGAGGGNTSITVNNVPPVVTTLTGPTGPLALGSATANMTANFTDVGVEDTHSCSVFWDDGSPNTPGSEIESGGSGFCSAAHTFGATGVYSVTVTVTDDDTGAVISDALLIVVYDPNGGFVTGGGWINSPLGAYVASPSLTGKANFGFVSKYQKGTNVPTGETEFQFHMASLNFHSDAYQWLVISGPKAQYKGTGTINGAGTYGFLLTATDGQVSGGGGVDKFRIKIWDINNSGTIVYDNVMGASNDIDYANPQTISSGSIVIHK